MERAVGEVFDFEGVKLQVKYAGDNLSCCGCYFFLKPIVHAIRWIAKNK